MRKHDVHKFTAENKHNERERERERERETQQVDTWCPRPSSTLLWPPLIGGRASLCTGPSTKLKRPAPRRQREGRGRRAGDAPHSAAPIGKTHGLAGGLASHRRVFGRWAACERKATPPHASDVRRRVAARTDGSEWERGPRSACLSRCGLARLRGRVRRPLSYGWTGW